MDKPTPDPIVAAHIAEHVSRAEFGVGKYGKDLSRTDLTEAEWLEHAMREAMDLGLYLRRAAEVAKARGGPADVSALAERITSLLFWGEDDPEDEVNEQPSERRQTFKDAVSAMVRSALPSRVRGRETQGDGWIPVSERYPSDGDPDLCWMFTPSGRVTECDASERALRANRATHWQPLRRPAAPKS